MHGPTPLTTPNDSSIGSRTSTQLCNEVPIGCNGMPQIHPPKLSQRRSPPPSNIPIPPQIPFTIPNSIQIHSAVLPQYTLRTDRPTDRWSRRKLRNISAYACLIEEDALKIVGHTADDDSDNVRLIIRPTIISSTSDS